MNLAAEFPQDADIVYLNHAAVAPWPRRSGEAVQRFADTSVSRGAADYPQWLKLERRLRERLAALVHAPSPDDVALVKNTSEALSKVAFGLDWRAGDNVVITDQEFPSNRIVWEALRPLGVEVRAAGLDGDDPEAAIRAAVDRNTRLMSISSVQYGTGLRLHLEGLGEYCRQRNILFCVDAIQSVGAVAFDVQAVQADFAMADGHKWMLGPEGLGFFYTTPAARDRLRLTEYGWHMVEHAGDFDREDWEPAQSARRFECGSPNLLGAHALEASLSLLQEIGMEVVETKVLTNARYLLQALHKLPNVELITHDAAGRYAGIVTFRPRRESAEQLFRRLREAGVVCAPRGGGIRFSPHCYNTIEQMDHAVRLVAGSE